MVRYVLSFIVFAWPLGAAAQNTSGVPGPAVTADATAVDYRASLSLDDERTTRLAHRIQIERGVSDTLRLRLVGQALTTDGDARPEYLQVDALWQLTADDRPFQTALRFDARLQDGARPERLGAVWIGQFALTDRLTVRGSVHGTIEIGDLARSGVSVETRGSAFYELGNGRRIGFEGFHDHGRTPDPEPFEGRQQIGPFVVLPIAEDWVFDISTLFGLSDQTQDIDLRFFVTREF